MSVEEQLEQWAETRDRIAAHLELLRARKPKLHVVGNDAAEPITTGIEKLTKWQAELDAVVIELLMPGGPQ
jgi:hypothetical protein